MMKGLKLVLGAVVLFLTTSCLNGGSQGGSSSVTYLGTITVKSLAGEQLYSKEGQKVKVSIPNNNQPKMNLEFIELVLSAEDTPVTLLFTNIDIQRTISNEIGLNYIFDVESATPYIEDVLSEDYGVTELKGSVGGSDRTIVFTLPKQACQVTFESKEKK